MSTSGLNCKQKRNCRVLPRRPMDLRRRCPLHNSSRILQPILSPDVPWKKMHPQMHELDFNPTPSGKSREAQHLQMRRTRRLRLSPDPGKHGQVMFPQKGSDRPRFGFGWSRNEHNRRSSDNISCECAKNISMDIINDGCIISRHVTAALIVRLDRISLKLSTSFKPISSICVNNGGNDVN